jgi:N-acyl homoserine lactone hydrolase
VVLPRLPRIDRLVLARVTRVPEWHPEHSSFEPFPVHGWLVHHPDGLILVDTGVGTGVEAINEWYRPEVIPLAEALAAVSVDTSDVEAVVLSHLHFDHCGQQGVLSAPVYVQDTEHRAAQAPRYTVAQWAAIAPDRLRLVHGDEELADGVRLLATSGHTPGHQSVLVETADERVVLAAQCAFRAHELQSGKPAATNIHDESWRDIARESLARLRTMGPLVAELSHDATRVQIT